MSKEKSHSFYHNYVFTKEDITRMTIPSWRKDWRLRLRLSLRPMMVQLAEGFKFRYKTLDGCYYYFGAEDMSEKKYD